MAVADHFDWEEKHCLPLLPKSLQRRLKLEHDVLRAKGFPREEVLLHAEMEMGWFRRFCPPEIIEQIERDHEMFRATGT